MTRILTGIKIHDFNCGLKAYRRKVIKAVDIYGGMHRYIPALAGEKGFSITESEVNHRPREFGKTKYGGNRYFHGFFDLFTMLFTSRYFNRPLHFFGSIGLLFIFISFACEVFSLYDKLINGIPFQTHFALIVFGAMVLPWDFGSFPSDYWESCLSKHPDHLRKKFILSIQKNRAKCK